MAGRDVFLDRCDADRRCVELPAVTPIMIHPVRDARRGGYSVTADYLCPRGHTWSCGWSATEEMLHDYDGETAA